MTQRRSQNRQSQAFEDSANGTGVRRSNELSGRKQLPEWPRLMPFAALTYWATNSANHVAGACSLFFTGTRSNRSSDRPVTS